MAWIEAIFLIGESGKICDSTKQEFGKKGYTTDRIFYELRIHTIVIQQIFMAPTWTEKFPLPPPKKEKLSDYKGALKYTQFIFFIGDGCADKPLSTLWKNYTSTDKPNIVMKVTVCASGELIIIFVFSYTMPFLCHLR